MPLKLTVGVSRKVGQPHFSSQGASCNVEVELDGSLLWSDPEAFRSLARKAFAACDRVVQDQLSRAGVAFPLRVVAAPEDAAGSPGRCSTASEHPATPEQRRTLADLADHIGLDLAQAAAEILGLSDLSSLTARQAGRLIGNLRNRSLAR